MRGSSGLYKISQCRGALSGTAGIHGKAAKLKRLARERSVCVEAGG